MDSVEQLVESIRQETVDYIPNLQIAESLSQTTLVMLIGATATGKSSLMLEAEKLDADFGMSRGFTTRPMRRGEKPENSYEFIPHTEAGLSQILDNVKKRSLVQVAIHPVTDQVYGSEIDDYRKPFTLIDTLYLAVDNLRQLPFGSIREIGIVSQPDIWWQRLINRSEIVGKQDTGKRVIEAIYSLEWLLAQGQDQLWLVNNEEPIDQNASKLIQIARGDLQSDPDGRKTAESLLRSINKRNNF